MNKLTIASIMAAAILIAGTFVFTIFQPAAAHLPYQGIVAGSVSVTAVGPNLTELSLKTPAPVPQDTNDLVGFGWLYTAFAPGDAIDDGFGITSHNTVRDGRQNPDQWHGHNVQFGAHPAVNTPGTPVSTFCVTKISDAPTSGIGIRDDITGAGSLVTVEARNSILTGTFPTPTSAAAFDIVIDSDCATIVASTYPPTPTAAPAAVPLGIIIDALGS